MLVSQREFWKIATLSVVLNRLTRIVTFFFKYLVDLSASPSDVGLFLVGRMFNSDSTIFLIIDVFLLLRSS